MFVCGRLCLLGEHSDWAGGFRSSNPHIEKGYCLVAGTSEGLRATVSSLPGPDASRVLSMTSTTDTGERRTRTFDLRDPGSLLEEARAGGFWCHVAGTAHHMVTTFAAKIAHFGVGIAIDNYDTNLPVKKGLSSSAAVCVLVARAFSRVFDLAAHDPRRDGRRVPRRANHAEPCGRDGSGELYILIHGCMDQACAFGPGRVSLLSFDGDDLDVTPIEDVGGPDGFHFVLADLGAGKDTVRILRDLQAAYPKATTDEYRKDCTSSSGRSTPRRARRRWTRWRGGTRGSSARCTPARRRRSTNAPGRCAPRSWAISGRPS